MREHTRVTLNFHPDRLRPEGITVGEGLLGDGRYRNQFETAITNGSPTAFAGGDRDRWEEKLFGGAYQEPGVHPAERPKYGALDLMQHADGGSPRFGSCYFVLRAEVSTRSTLTWGDSHDGPTHVGTIEAIEPIIAALLETAETTHEALGVADLDVSKLIELLSSAGPRAAEDPADRTPGRALDAYIEAQVHGDIDLAADVDAVVIDPAFDGTPTGDHLRALSSRYGMALYRHPGFVLAPRDVPPDFRGPRMVPLAKRVATFSDTPDELDAATLGRAAAALHRNPETWTDWGTPEETWQHIKQLWHVLVQFGRPRPASR